MCGTQRLPGGRLSGLAGRIPALDSIAKSFLAAGPEQRSALLSSAKELVSNTTGEYYVKVFNKLLDSADYVEKEATRLQKLAAKYVSRQRDKANDPFLFIWVCHNRLGQEP
jgi:protein disulfide-isomerase A6